MLTGRSRKRLPGASPARYNRGMRSTLALLAILSAAPALASLPRPKCVPVEVRDLATLGPAAAARLRGVPALYRVERDSLAGELDDGCTGMDCVSVDAVYRSVRLLPGEPVGDVMFVRATLVILEHGATYGFPPLLEYRLVGAVRVPWDRGVRPDPEPSEIVPNVLMLWTV